jgi:hypothetical protein
VDHSTTTVLRGANGSLPGTTGALLLERLCARTSNLTTVLHLVGSLAGSCALGDNYLVHKGHIGLDIEKLSRKIDRARLLTRGVEDVNCAHP